MKTLNWVKSQLSGFLTRATADGLYLGKTAKASSAAVADSANSVQWANVQGKPSIGGSWSASNETSGYARDPATGFTVAWNRGSSFSFNRRDYAAPGDANTQTIYFARSMTIRGCSVQYELNSGSMASSVTCYVSFGSNSVTVRSISQQDGNGTTTVTPIVTVYGFS
nr:MAG TPA: hypothetical protein [Caudoviricetes sp.]